MIRTYIREGQVVPMEVTIKLLENAMRAAIEDKREGEGWADGKGRFLVDGFPRKMDQAIKFDEEVRVRVLRACGRSEGMLGVHFGYGPLLHHDRGRDAQAST